MTVRILHTGDLHLPKHGDPERGTIKRLLDALRGSLGPYDVWVDCGDLLPDPPPSLDPQRVTDTRLMPEAWTAAAEWQMRWADKAFPRIVEALGDRPALVIDGNHHWLHAAVRLEAWGNGNVHAMRHGEVVEACGLRWTGLPHTPPLGGCFRREVHPYSWPEVLAEIPAADVLVSHAPPAGPLSKHPEWGVPGLDRLPHPLILCGHIHEHGGQEHTERGQRVINGATWIRIVEVES